MGEGQGTNGGKRDGGMGGREGSGGVETTRRREQKEGEVVGTGGWR